MKTDRLIHMLSANLEPAKPHRLGGVLVLALVAGGAIAFCAMLATVGLSIEPTGATGMGYLALKLLLAASLIAVGAVFLVRSSVPGRSGGKAYALSFLPLLAISAMGVAALLYGRPAAWPAMLFGTQWGTCAICIPLFAIPPFVALIWALRRGAPTDLRRTGAVAGLIAGALGAAAYAFHCPDDSIPFIALWYVGAIAFCAAIGAMLGPRLLRW